MFQGEFYERLMTCQSLRMEEQRCEMPSPSKVREDLQNENKVVQIYASALCSSSLFDQSGAEIMYSHTANDIF